MLKNLEINTDFLFMNIHTTKTNEQIDFAAKY